MLHYTYIACLVTDVRYPCFPFRKRSEKFDVFLTVYHSIDYFQVTNLMHTYLFHNNIYVTL